MTKLDIVIPVYNAIECVSELLDSLVKIQIVKESSRIYIVDDYSNPETRTYLQRFGEEHENVTVIFNEANLGYTITLNKGIRAGSSPYVVQINSDCIVSQEALPKLLSHLENDPGLFAVSPMTNAGSFQSLPNVFDTSKTQLAVNSLLDGLTLDSMDKFCGAYSRGLALTQLLNGFCVMYARGPLLEVGLPDETLFPRGYGEEDDLHLRATGAGYELAIATDAYVFHQKTKSFTSQQKATLSQQGRKLVDQAHGAQRVKRITRSLRIHPRLEPVRIAARNYRPEHAAPLSLYLDMDWNTGAAGRTSGLTSIVMPVYRHASMTVTAIETLLTSLHPGVTEFELIVVLNGADEETSNSVWKLSREGSFRVVDTGENYFFSMACNIGFMASTGGNVVFVNNDMVFNDPGWLDSIVGELKDPEVGCASVKLEYEDGSIQSAGFHWSKESFFPIELFKNADASMLTQRLVVGGVTGACLGVRAQDFADLRGFDPLYINGSEDIDFCLKMLVWLDKYSVVDPEFSIVHLESKSPNRGKFVKENRRYYFENWAGRISNIATELSSVLVKADSFPSPIRMYKLKSGTFGPFS